MILRNLSTRNITLRDSGNTLYTVPALGDLTVTDTKWSDTEFRRWIRYRIRDLAVATATAGDAISNAPTTSAQNVIQGGATTVTALTLKAVAGQTVPTLQLQGSGGTAVLNADGTGGLQLLNTLTVGSLTVIGSTQASITTTATGNIGFVVRGISGQTADLVQWQGPTGTVLAAVTAAGSLTFAGDSSISRSAANTLTTNTNTGLIAVGGIATKTKAGIPTDADVVTGMQVVGAMIVDTTDNRLYVRTGASTWRYAALT